VHHGLQDDNTCALCPQASETPAHLLLSCVYSRELWFLVLRRLGLLRVLPPADAEDFVDWWLPTRKRLLKRLRKHFDTLMLLACLLI
jgi:hypothetical protein